MTIIERLCELVENTPLCSVKGRLKKHVTFWKSVHADSYTVDVIEHGYVVPFIETPETLFKQNNK